MMKRKKSGKQLPLFLFFYLISVFFTNFLKFQI